MEPIPTKPYLIRAIHEWCVDNGLTPYVAVSVDERAVVPAEHVRNGEIVLNVSGAATSRLLLGNEWIEFQARFGGAVRDLSIPVDRVTAIYARENGQGMAFEVASTAALGPAANAGDAQPSPDAARERGPATGPRLVDSGEGASSDSAPPTGTRRTGGKGVRGPGPAAALPRTQKPKDDGPPTDSDDDPPQPPRGRGKPKLTRIK